MRISQIVTALTSMSLQSNMAFVRQILFVNMIVNDVSILGTKYAIFWTKYVPIFFFEGGYARGECVGKEEWECECISANDVRVEYNFDIPEETTPSGSPEYENVETFDA